ncbi:MAG: hypothetical protein EHM27_11850, partial [Deltaproteobacteria bacterium]
MERANDNTLVIIQPETQLALDNIEKLVSIPGVDGVMIGPNDLSLPLGISGELKHPRMVAAYERVIAACRKHRLGCPLTRGIKACFRRRRRGVSS